MYNMASVSLEQEVLLIGKNSNYIIIIDSIAGRFGIFSYSGGSWIKVGQLENARNSASATRILVNTNLCNDTKFFKCCEFPSYNEKCPEMGSSSPHSTVQGKLVY